MPDRTNPITEDVLKAASMDHRQLPGSRFEVADIAAELQRNRRARQRDTRRTDHIRRVRWLIENALTKIEDAEERNDEDEYIPEKIAAWLESLNETTDPKEIAKAIREGMWK